MYKDLYKCECEKIKTSEIKDIVQNTTKFIPEYFYRVPSSSTGMYHPKDELSEGGLVRHTIKCVIIAKELARFYNLDDYELDLCIAALLLHDCCKNGKLEDTGHTEFLHPKFAAELIVEANLGSKVAEEIAKLVKSHMGRWNVDTHGAYAHLPLPKTRLQKIVSLCDYIASRKCLNVLLGSTDCNKTLDDIIVLTKEEYAELEADYDKVYEQAKNDFIGNIADGGTSCHWCIDGHKKQAYKEILQEVGDIEADGFPIKRHQWFVDLYKKYGMELQ